MGGGSVAGRKRVYQAVLIPSDIREPERGYEGVEVRERGFLFRRKGSDLMIPVQEGGENHGFLSSRQLRRIIHQPGFKNGLHSGVKKQIVVAAAIKVEDAQPAVLGPVQIAVADVALNGIARFLCKGGV